MPEEQVYYHDAWMIRGWPEKIHAAQRERTYEILGRKYVRIPYGSEPGVRHAETRVCHDCAVLTGQLHVPGCDMERCPRCRGQAIGCDCTDEEERRRG